MTTMRVTSPVPVLIWLVLLAVLAALAVGRMLPTGMPATPQLVQPLPELTAHALEHEDSRVARDWVQRHGRFCRWECPDGRTRFACPMAEAGRFAVVVLGRSGLITAFTTNQDYALGAIEGCRNPWRYAHP